jgi:putative redox protein
VSDITVEARWQDGLRFESAGRGGAAVVLDGDAEAGPSPMEALLMALVGCMGVDVVDILRKMRVPLAGLVVRADGDRRAEPPRRFTAIRLSYRADGVPAADREKLQRAVDLSRDTYCSVLHTLQPDLDITVLIEDG